MPNKKNIAPFPQQDIPHHPESLASSSMPEQSSTPPPSPLAALTPQAQEEVKNESLSQVVEPPVQEIKSLPGKFGPKKILSYLAALLIVVILIFVAVRLFASGGSTYGKKGEIVWWGIQHEREVFAPL